MMSKLIIIVVSLFGLISVCVGQVVQEGQCDASLGVYENFDILMFLGEWYEIARTSNPNQDGDCAAYDFTIDSNNAIDVQYTSVRRNFLEEATGTITQEGNTAKLKMTLSSFEEPVDFWILATMYDTYAVAYSCENISLTQRKIHIWVLGRGTTVNAMFIGVINSLLVNNFGINYSDLTHIDHSPAACYVLPTIEPGNPIILPGQCDESLLVLSNFNADAFSGLWHQISSYESSNSDGTCVRAEYTLSSDGVDILNSQVINQRLVTIDGSATIISTDNSAKLRVVLNTPGAPSTTQDLWILASDYENYAVSYSCTNINSYEKRIFSWILGRSRQLSPQHQTAVDEVVNSYIELNYQYYKPTDQSFDGCFFYPEASDQPVVFRGQCESVNVQAMSDFSAIEYMGKWHSIRSYPTRFQDGTCVNAYYSLTPDGINVLNSQVNNLRLETMSGVAVPSSNDGSAKLVVSFPVAGSDQTTSTDYWVLDTDYKNFALVYSCQNINDDEMQVNSWILSRTKLPPVEHEQRINEKINSVIVLDEKYYKFDKQTEDDCFYFPDPEPGVPVIFPGQCDETVNVVPPFDLQQFDGDWYEIESYPNAQQSGHCRNHKVTVLDNSRLNLEFSSISNQFLHVTSGVVTQSNTNDGKLSIEVTNANGEVTNIPFWILGVQYNDYALAYSCVNINSDFRSVKSWKLSRTRQLTADADTAINTIINNNLVLGNEYFEDIDHSDAACFYLPEIEAGEPIILPGQCDTTIKGILDFKINEFAGRWRLIESYGSEFQRGTCNEAEYVLQADNSISVINSQVINENLESITGSASVASTDGTGHLRISFPNREEYFDFYVLDVNYESYALGYGCVNLANNERRIYSWKLSRYNTLSPEAVTKINAVIDSVQVLNNAYYYTIDRDDTSCFYYPIPNLNSYVKFRGQCDQNIPVVKNFELEKYLGVWYDIQSYPGDFQDGTCNTAEYSPGNNGIHVYNTQVIDQSLVSISGNAVLEPSNDGSAKLKVTFNVAGTDVTTDYWVLSTNYESYALVYSCTNIDDYYMRVSSWKLSREKVLEATDETAISNAMNDIKVLDQRYFVKRDQDPDGCFYFPEPQPGVPVVFPGQCDDSIAAVPNFDINEFAGTWHEISAYPRASQSGQCISQQFTLTNDNTMHLESFSVLDQFQSSTEGTVTVASTDGSGRLNINIQSNAEPIPFWILSVKYDDYALAYSCVNIDRNYRKVHSWKLSRSRELSSTGNAVINDAMTNIDVIDDRYFENVEQTDEACFHLPDITPGENIVLPGQCDPTIKGIADFRIADYAGQWRLIESYGSPFQSGTCNVAEYILQSSNTLGITNSQVVNEVLTTISGTATISSTDGTGQLTFNMRNREYVMLVLATDYKSYALTYGCENIDNDRRRITSWKFSRYNTLTTDATNAINKVIEEIEVLHQPYYYSVDRRPEACFYFPEFNPNSNVIFRGQCDQTIEAVKDFDLNKYMNLWYDVESYPSAFQDGTCPNAHYTLTGNTVSVRNSHVVDQTLVTIDGVATLASTDGSGKLKVTFNVQNTEVTTDYWVLSTNYESYALVYSCTNIDDDYMRVSSWKLSREKVLEAADETAISNAMNDIKVLDQRYFVKRDQDPDGCFYFPEPQPGVPVVFPGQCDDSIAAVPNFDINEFAGTWHEISAYPRASQSGQCISQQFTLTNDNTMHLESFSVLDQFQSSTEGTVTVASTDGSGRLNINIQSNAEPIPFWILSVKYDEYALAYSCVNIDRNYRKVHSWKLSRSRELSSTGNAVINDAMTNIDVIDDRYFENVEQTDEACFHYPDLGPNDPVIFPGQCDLNIPVIQDFDIIKYLGRWRLLESYYSEFQEGTCNAASYAASSDGTLIVTNSKVVNEQLTSIVGSAVPLASDGSGKLVVTFPDRTPTEYWILATDYDSYALVYTCVNLPNHQRRVWSWKMSRFSTLPPSATTAINDVINNIDVLDERYYQKIDRTDASCFYYPAVDSDFDVIFPGQCDDSIDAVENFNPQEYEGTWFDIESYPTRFQSGTCNTAEYSPNPDGTLQVVNTQVSGQILQTTTGVAYPTSNDGSGKFDVTLTQSNGNVVTTKYWVLATDYTSYSLVYSCRNIDDEFRAVHSWKLGRGTYLPDDAQAKINEELDKVQVLEQKYYVERKHSDEDCFYYPDNNGGDVILPGQCVPDAQVPAVTGFNSAEFAGTWHEVARFPSDLQNGECSATEFTLVDGNFNIVKTSVIDEAQLSTATSGTLATDGRGVIYNINIDGVPFNSIYILLTDYNEYALAYSCRNLDAERKQIYSWKLSKSRAGLSESAHSAIQEHVSNNIDLFEGYYRTTKQDNTACFHYPEFDQLPSSIELPGPCDASIKGIANFDGTAFSGKWFEVARYPQPIQTGQCNSAVYNNSGDVISIVSTQVVNEKLLILQGNANIASTDGSGLLDVSLGDGDDNIEAKLYVLATDYINYAILYNCINLDNGNRRRVGSWKLSRSGTLSPQDNDVINEVVSSTQGLINKYYLHTDRSDEACFHYPDPSESEVILPGQCDESISGVSSFDMERFQGTWYQIERYDAVQTSCIGLKLTSYNSESNEFEVLSYEVSDGELSTVEGTGQLSTDGTGRLSVVMSEGNSATTILILSTDYESYAVAYSCSNLGGSQRQVRAWQLSRTRSMSPAGVTAIAGLIEQRQELHQPYFKSIPHDNDCLEPSSAFLFKSSIIVIFVCAVLQLLL
uniref:Polycalin n=1 Tax=Spodoptera littoralis TaxID=7109 RepID=A0A863CKP6_SPOLI|nr:polycalin [Spodoptera littoralis]